MAGGKFWSEEDIEFLRKNYDAMTSDQLALVLGRTKSAINQIANEIGVKKSPASFGRCISNARKKHKIEIESLREQVTLLRDVLSDFDKAAINSKSIIGFAGQSFKLITKMRKALAATEPERKQNDN